MRINIGGLLTKRAAMTPDREGLVCEDVRRTYKQLNDRANRLVNTMRALGVTHGDRVGILALNEPEYYDMYFGLGKIGAILQELEDLGIVIHLLDTSQVVNMLLGQPFDARAHVPRLQQLVQGLAARVWCAGAAYL